MTRPRDEIMRDLKAILAELDYAMGNIGPDSEPDISPKLNQALSSMAERDREPRHTRATMPFDIPRHSRASMPSVADVPIESHEDIRAKARAYKPQDYSAPDIRPDEVNRPEKPERLKDYVPADDPDHDNSWALGTGDQKVME